MDSRMQEASTTSSSTFQLDVSSSGAVKLKAAVKAKLAEFMGSYTDDVLAEYVVVLVGHGKRQAQAMADLEAFLGDQSGAFVSWLWDHLSKNQSLYVVQAALPVAGANLAGKRSSEVLESRPGATETQPASQHRGPLRGMTTVLNIVPAVDEKPAKAVKDSCQKVSTRGKDDSVTQGLTPLRALSASHAAGENQDLQNDEKDDAAKGPAPYVKHVRSPEPCSQRERGCLEDKARKKSDVSSPRVRAPRAPRRLLESAVRDAVGPAGVSMNTGSASRRLDRTESRLLDSAARDAFGPSILSVNNASVARRTERADRTELRLLGSAVRDAVGSAGVSITSGNSVRRTESRLLESAVRDAVGHNGLVSIGSRRTESGVKRLRSVVSADVAGQPNGRYHHLKSRIDLSKQGSRVPAAVAVALKAAAAAAEDVNNASTLRRRSSMSSTSVWDRLGNRTSERFGLTENEVEVVERGNEGNEADRDRQDENNDEAEDQMAKRQKGRRISDRLGKSLRNDQDEVEAASALNPGSAGYVQSKKSLESTRHCSVAASIIDMEEEIDLDKNIEDVAKREDGKLFRHSPLTGSDEYCPGKSQDSASLQYRHGPSEKEKGTDNVEQPVISGFSRAENPTNKVHDSGVNFNVSIQQSKGADASMHVTCDLFAQPLKCETLLGKSAGPAGVDTNDVLEMKKRMRQVQLEMTKLRAKQAEVSKEVQKGGSAPASAGLKPRSQEDIDAHSVSVTNIHFAATKEVIAAHFGNCGDIVRVTVLTDISTGKPRGSAYVEFSSKDGVDKALNLNDSSLLSRTLKVSRKDAKELSVSSIAGRPSRGSAFLSVRAPAVGKFLRGTPRNLRRLSSIARPFSGTANLQWKRDTASPSSTKGAPSFGQSNGSMLPPSGHATAFRGSSFSLAGDRYGLGPIRVTRSMSYIRPTPYPSRDGPGVVQEQKVAN